MTCPPRSRRGCSGSPGEVSWRPRSCAVPSSRRPNRGWVRSRPFRSRAVVGVTFWPRRCGQSARRCIWIDWLVWSAASPDRSFDVDVRVPRSLPSSVSSRLSSISWASRSPPAARRILRSRSRRDGRLRSCRRHSQRCCGRARWVPVLATRSAKPRRRCLAFVRWSTRFLHPIGWVHRSPRSSRGSRPRSGLAAPTRRGPCASGPRSSALSARLPRAAGVRVAHGGSRPRRRPRPPLGDEAKPCSESGTAQRSRPVI